MEENRIQAYIYAASTHGGVASLCYCLSVWEIQERYEECATILAAIRRLMGEDWNLDGGIRWGKPLENWLDGILEFETDEKKSTAMYLFSSHANDLNNIVHPSIYPI